MASLGIMRLRVPGTLANSCGVWRQTLSDAATLYDVHPADDAPPDCLGHINRAIDFVLLHLDRSPTLDELARAACLSPFHFHRVFKLVVGETPAQFTRRVRLERAITILSHDPKRPLTAVALDCGFASSSDFSRAFKQRYGVPPSAFDIESWRGERRDELHRLVEAGGVAGPLAPPAGENPDGFVVSLRALPPRTVAYRRVLHPYREGVVVEAAARLVAWAEAEGLADGRWYGYMWDDPEVVALPACRYDVAVELPSRPRLAPPADVGVYEFPAMTVAEISMDGGIDLEMRLLEWLYREWLPTSGYLPDDQPCFEAWAGRPFAHGVERFELAVQLPVCRGGKGRRD